MGKDTDIATFWRTKFSLHTPYNGTISTSDNFLSNKNAM
jgi:hypothetical protein